jgi:pantoate--beta-alanine ligase
VKESLLHNDLTVVSIFVNPAQFAPHEDLEKYPRTFDSDMETLSKLSVKTSSTCDEVRTPSAVFAPTAQEMYPSGISQDRTMQKGTFVEVI